MTSGHVLAVLSIEQTPKTEATGHQSSFIGPETYLNLHVIVSHLVKKLHYTIICLQMPVISLYRALTPELQILVYPNLTGMFIMLWVKMKKTIQVIQQLYYMSLFISVRMFSGWHVQCANVNNKLKRTV